MSIIVDLFQRLHDGHLYKNQIYNLFIALEFFYPSSVFFIKFCNILVKINLEHSNIKLFTQTVDIKIPLLAFSILRIPGP